MNKEKIALLTYKEEPNLADSELLLPPAFALQGIEALPAPWDGDVNWKQFSTIILRACWNYHLKRDAFLNWLEQMSSDGKQIWNPLEILKWNTDKHYLKDLEREGTKIVPSVILEAGDETNLSEVLARKNWTDGIIKPTVGASAFGVKKFNLETAPVIDKQVDRNHPWLVQKFCPEVNSEGEYSLIFFGRNYSHSVMKKPKEGDFRTQPYYGGTEWEIEPDKRIVDQAGQIIDRVKGQLLYSRVDGLVINGDFHLMELELAEPYLFLGSHPLAPQRFVESYKKLSKG